MKNIDLVVPLMFAAMVALAVAILAVKDRWVARVERKTGRKKGGRPWHEPIQAVFRVFILGTLAIAGMAVLVRRLLGMPVSEGATAYLLALGAFAAITVGLTLLHSLYQNWKFSDRDVNACLATAQGGDPERAIAELKAIIQSKGPSVNRLNGLGLLHASRESWDEALAAFDEAIRLGGRRSYLLGSRAVMLWKTGRFDEAEATLVAAIGKNRQDYQLAINHANFLVDLGRLDEARAELDRAEAIYRQIGFVLAGKATRDAIEHQFREQVDSVRARLAAVSPEKKDDLTGLDEL